MFDGFGVWQLARRDNGRRLDIARWIDRSENRRARATCRVTRGRRPGLFLGQRLRVVSEASLDFRILLQAHLH
jgi:hypothetical protein